jgi:hypothetical protein
MHIVILANHQHAGLAASLRALLPAARIDSFDLGLLGRDTAERALAMAAVEAADHIVSHDVPPGYGKLSTGALRTARRALHLLPVFRFSGFHPDSVTITLDGAFVAGPTGLLHSRIAIAAFLAGLPVEDAAALYNSLVFARLGYYHAYAAERARLIRTFSIYGYDIAGCFDAWVAPGCFVFDATRPRMRVLLDIGRLLCARMGLVPESDVTEAAVANPLASAPMQPLFPDIAARIGVSPEGGFRGDGQAPPRAARLNLDAFLGLSFEVYRKLPLAALRGVEGVAASLPALYLREADFGRTAAAARAAAAPAEEAVFLTWHGKLLSIETATGTLVQAPAWPDAADSTPAAAAIETLPMAAPVDIALAGGLRAAPAGGGAIRLSQQDRALIAPRLFQMVRFSTEPPPPNSDLFLPIRRAELAALRALPAASLRPGFILAVGAHRIDLSAARIARADGRVVLQTPEETIALAESAGAANTAVVYADLESLPTAASLEQFRAAPGLRLHLHGAAEMVHLPLTVDNAARNWLLEKFHGGAPKLGRQALRVTAARAADKFVRLDRGAEGIIFDANGVWARAGVPGTPPAPQDCAKVAKLGDPVCVFYTPHVHDPYSWVAEAALSLHILQPILPPDARLLLPADLPGGFDHMAALAALGLAGLPLARVQAKLVRAADVVWLEQDQISAMPAALVQSFRARVHTLHPPPAARRMIFLKPARGPGIARPAAMESFLQSRGCETVCLRDATTPEAITLFGAADMIVAPRQAALAGLLFCKAGTRVLELAPDDAFRPNFWQMSEKLGLLHAVLPCETIDTTAQSDLLVDIEQLRALFRMLRLSAA